MISGVIDPILNSKDPLDQDVIDRIESLNDQLLNATEVENINLPLASLLTDRLLQDAEEKGDLPLCACVIFPHAKSWAFDGHAGSLFANAHGFS